MRVPVYEAYSELIDSGEYGFMDTLSKLDNLYAQGSLSPDQWLELTDRIINKEVSR